MVHVLNDKVTEPVTRVSGSVFWEVLHAFTICLPFFTHGVGTSLGEPFEDAFVYNTTTRWYQAAMLVAGAASAPIFAFISQKFGRKIGYFCISLVQGLVFIPVFIGNYESLPYTYILVGISSGGVFTILLPYIREITSIRTRGFCLAMTIVLELAGYQLRVLVREFYDPMIYLVLGLVTVQLILVLWVVESPAYFLLVGKTEHAKESLASLRRLPEDSPSILNELNTIRDEVANGTDGHTTLLSLYRNKISWDSIKMGLLLFTTMELCGNLVFLDAKNACDCGIGLRDPNIIVAFVLGGSIVTLVLVTIVDRKYLMTFGYVAMAVSLGVYGVFSQIHIASAVDTALAMATGLSLPVLLIAYGMASGLPAVVIVDMFNVKVCTPILAALYSYSQLLKFLHAHTYQYLEEYVGAHSMLYVFAGVNLYGGVYALFVLPNIRNKNLKQIERQIKRIPLPA